VRLLLRCIILFALSCFGKGIQIPGLTPGRYCTVCGMHSAIGTDCNTKNPEPDHEMDAWTHTPARVRRQPGWISTGGGTRTRGIRLCSRP